jgi:aminoglycoside phosphotransferase (APT) family kinase protein
MMEGWKKKTSRKFQKNGLEPRSMKRINRGDENTVVEVKTGNQDFIIKWFTSDMSPVIPQPGGPKDRFTGGWYVQSRLDDILEIPIPSILTAEFSKDDSYYIMEKVTDFQDSDVWFKDTFTLTLCREIGSILSRLHSVSKSSIGGIPGKDSDATRNMRRVMKQTEKNIRDTPYRNKKDQLKNLSDKYEDMYADRKASIVHGDLVASNILTNSDGIVKGITDWDDSMYSDPLYDIAIFHSMACDIMGEFCPWDKSSLRETVIESYSNAVDRKRLKILRAVVHLDSAAKIHKGDVLTTWSEVSQKTKESRKNIHENTFDNLLSDLS